MDRPISETQSRWSLAMWLGLVATWLIFGRGVCWLLDTIAMGVVK
jgi:hypothetical protein